MEIKFKAAFDGKTYRVLVDSADLSIYKHVDEFVFNMRPSDILSMAKAYGIVSAITPPQPNGARSQPAEDYMLPIAYVVEHAISITKSGVAITPIDAKAVMELGWAVANWVYRDAEAPGNDFLAAAPPPQSKVGEKDTQTNSETSTKS